ncbi:hypothetical protein N7474_007373 [Penicillium riverlandense]|uniref:uncharacterized protein n=1 Tax=Penicillium riverlandense TaxID=1903569 RepID=UPI00254809B0|nr:uncharacterized protein N7474_007373 [Penicillium riverlandense]KAJ5815596.1 hypothetical protein N7474_007373 [Penicillium riverlandense]
MKTFLAVGLLAALCQSAFSLDEGIYQIGSASLSPSMVLTQNEDEDSNPIVFEVDTREFTQLWNITASNEFPEYFAIQALSGTYINCGTDEGTNCSLTDDPHLYKPEAVGDKAYELVEKESGYFLLVNDDRKLQLSNWDHSPEEQFVFVEFQE